MNCVNDDKLPVCTDWVRGTDIGYPLFRMKCMDAMNKKSHQNIPYFIHYFL